MESIDALQLNLGGKGLLVMNISLCFIMFGVALELTVRDFKNLVKNPKSTLGGVFSQFIFLPAITFVLVYFLKLHLKIGKSRNKKSLKNLSQMKMRPLLIFLRMNGKGFKRSRG